MDLKIKRTIHSKIPWIFVNSFEAETIAVLLLFLIRKCRS